MDSKKGNKNLKKEAQFEKELLQNLIYYGYLFPGNSKSVERFEAIYGDTDIDMPDHLANLDYIEFNKTFETDFDLTLDKAAFSSNDHAEFDCEDFLKKKTENLDEKKPE